LWIGIANLASDGVQRAPEAAVRYVSGPEQQFSTANHSAAISIVASASNDYGKIVVV
jgi:hypothetical protein